MWFGNAAILLSYPVIVEFAWRNGTIAGVGMRDHLTLVNAMVFMPASWMVTQIVELMLSIVSNYFSPGQI
jgi:hypothetical protein